MLLLLELLQDLLEQHKGWIFLLAKHILQHVIPRTEEPSLGFGPRRAAGRELVECKAVAVAEQQTDIDALVRPLIVISHREHVSPGLLAVSDLPAAVEDAEPGSDHVRALLPAEARLTPI